MAERSEVTGLLASTMTESGANLLELNQASPVLLVFLRHFGCSFCRQTIEQVGELQPQLEARGVRPVFVHLGTPEIAQAHFSYYGMGDVERVHDPQAKLYQHPAFGLSRTNPYSHFLKPKVLAGWFVKGVAFKNGFGKIQGDGEQMPGVFVLKDGAVTNRFVHTTIADQPDYLGMVG